MDRTKFKMKNFIIVGSLTATIGIFIGKKLLNKHFKKIEMI